MKPTGLQKVNYGRHIIMAYPFATCIILVIWVICLMPIPETPLSHLTLFDNLRRHRELNKMRLFIGIFLAPLLMGGLIELAQATCTGGNRSGDWLDFAANSIGVVLGNLIGMLLVRCFAKGKRD